MSLEKWVEYGWLRREPTSPGDEQPPPNGQRAASSLVLEDLDTPSVVQRSRIFWELWIVALRIQRSKLFRPTFDLSLLSTPRSVATTALRASGLRTVTQAGHHVKTIDLWNSP